MSDTDKARTASLSRGTSETTIKLDVNLDGEGKTQISSGLKFLDHLITTFSKYSLVDIQADVKSNDSIVHHLIEDIAICMGQSLDKALGDRARIMRFGYAIVPMDDSRSNSAIDLVRRQYSKFELKLERNEVEGIAKEDIEHFFRSLLQNLVACSHILVEYGEDDHHKLESAIKSFAIAFRNAAAIDQRRKGLPSTKDMM
ncbi:MAG TPA: imidazoleglycerol-phosphate dehydratase [Nitrososphaeraceae archaeon]|nr:imidazoleglycerol-phosphate dehydratase [Nitrososphaeraceae archaeon]